MMAYVFVFFKGIPPAKKEGEKKEDSNSLEGKGIASRIIGQFKPVSISFRITEQKDPPKSQNCFF